MAPSKGAIDISNTIEQLATKLAPKLQTILSGRRDEIIAKAGDLPTRIAVRTAYPIFLRETPELLFDALDLVVDEFGHMNLNDLIAFLNHSAEQKTSYGDERDSLRLER